jgi:plasmid stability protein
MADISIRKLEPATVALLRERAARHGVSMEEEARRILRAAVAEPQPLSQLAGELFGPEHGVELEMPVHEAHEPIEVVE